MSLISNTIIEENEGSDEDNQNDEEEYDLAEMDEEQLQKHRERFATVKIHPRASDASRASNAGEPFIQIEDDMYESSSEDE